MFGRKEGDLHHLGEEGECYSLVIFGMRARKENQNSLLFGKREVEGRGGF